MRYNQQRLYSHGFTLIELSIVLVIIGLIVGGVLVGRELINAALIRSQISQVEKINTAVNSFKNKYNCLPGDCPNAKQFFSATTQPTAVTNGNGNGIICGFTLSNDCNAPPLSNPNNGGWAWYWSEISEFMSVFDHLAASGLWIGSQYSERLSDSVWSGPVFTEAVPDLAFPKLKIESTGIGPLFAPGWGNQIGGVVVGWDPSVYYIKAGHKIRLGYCLSPRSAYGNFECGLNPWEAYALDAKIDDGKPLTGNVVIGVSGPYAPNLDDLGPQSDYCHSRTGALDYRSESNLATYGGSPVNRFCAVIISASF